MQSQNLKKKYCPVSHLKSLMTFLSSAIIICVPLLLLLLLKFMSFFSKFVGFSSFTFKWNAFKHLYGFQAWNLTFYRTFFPIGNFPNVLLRAPYGECLFVRYCLTTPHFMLVIASQPLAIQLKLPTIFHTSIEFHFLFLLNYCSTTATAVEQWRLN